MWNGLSSGSVGLPFRFHFEVNEDHYGWVERLLP